jgi:hypothetical protein
MRYFAKTLLTQNADPLFATSGGLLALQTDLSVESEENQLRMRLLVAIPSPSLLNALSNPLIDPRSVWTGRTPPRKNSSKREPL